MAPSATPLGPLLAAATLLMAGCASQPGGSTTGAEDCTLEPVLCDPEHYLAEHHCIENEVRPLVYAPDTGGRDAAADPWRQGDFWTYRLQSGETTRTSVLVYYEDADFASSGEAQHYLVGVPDRADALDHALFSVNPMIGRIHRALYSPHEAGEHADMFHFPLCEGSTWQTSFYGRTFRLAAARGDVRLPDGSLDPLGFVITGQAPDGSTVRHTYSPVVKWFTEIRLERADGVSVFLQLTDYGSGRAGRVEFLRAQQDAVMPVAQIPAEGVVVERGPGVEGPYDRIGVYLELQAAAGTGKMELHLRDPSGASKACVGIAGSGPLQTTTCPAGPLKLEVPWAEGAWRVTLDRLVVDSQVPVQGEARVVSIYDRGGTV